MAVLGIAVVAAIQLSSQALRLIRLAGEHQDAVHLADRLARGVDPDAAGVETGTEGAFQWERRVAAVAVDPELTPTGLAAPRLFSVSVFVRWGRSQVLELATLRSAPPEALPQTGPTPTPSPGTPRT